MLTKCRNMLHSFSPTMKGKTSGCYKSCLYSEARVCIYPSVRNASSLCGVYLKTIPLYRPESLAALYVTVQVQCNLIGGRERRIKQLPSSVLNFYTIQSVGLMNKKSVTSLEIDTVFTLILFTAVFIVF